MTLVAARPLARVGLSGMLGRRVRVWTAVTGMTLFGILVASAYLMPLGYMAATSLKDATQMSEAGAPLWPARPSTFLWEGNEYPVYNVPTADGALHQWALVDPRREDATFIDPAHPESGTIEWQGRWRTLEQAWQFSLNVDNFASVLSSRRPKLICCHTVAKLSTFRLNCQACSSVRHRPCHSIVPLSGCAGSMKVA